MLTVQEVLEIHSILIEKFGGTHGVRDKSLRDFALHRPYQTFDSKELYPTLMIRLLQFWITGGRTSKQNEENDHQGWQFQINAKAGLFSNTISGLGMHPEANQLKDQYDRIRVPRFVQFVDITFPHNEYFAPNKLAGLTTYTLAVENKVSYVDKFLPSSEVMFGENTAFQGGDLSGNANRALAP